MKPRAFAWWSATYASSYLVEQLLIAGAVAGLIALAVLGAHAGLAAWIPPAAAALAGAALVGPRPRATTYQRAATAIALALAAGTLPIAAIQVHHWNIPIVNPSHDPAWQATLVLTIVVGLRSAISLETETRSFLQRQPSLRETLAIVIVACGLYNAVRLGAALGPDPRLVLVVALQVTLGAALAVPTLSLMTAGRTSITHDAQRAATRVLGAVAATVAGFLLLR